MTTTINILFFIIKIKAHQKLQVVKHQNFTVNSYGKICFILFQKGIEMNMKGFTFEVTGSKYVAGF